MLKREYIFSFLMIFPVFLFISRASCLQAEDKKVTLNNEYWDITLDPRWGARASSMKSLTSDCDFVSIWGDIKKRLDGDAREGGVFRSMMSGSYVSSQPEEPYNVIKTSSTEAVFEYENRHPLMDGLREDRKITLEGRDAVFSVKVTNIGRENRVIYYRIQDWIGTGRREGKDSVHVIPKDEGMPFAFTSNPGESVNSHFINPSENWYALADLVNNRGLLVTSRTAVAGIYFWESGGDIYRRTAEVFFPCVKLAPGQSWEMEMRYRAFAPDSPGTGDNRLDSVLSRENILKYLAGVEEKKVRTGLPFGAEMDVDYRKQPLTIAPLHPASTSLGGSIAPDYGRTLRKIYLYGTPGEVVSFACAVTANRDIEKGTAVFGDLKSGRRIISSGAFEPGYVAGKSVILVKSWDLSRNVPYKTISFINNDVRDADSLTPFSLKKGDSAYIWTNLRIPVNASAGQYSGRCTIDAGDTAAEFEISLKVRPFMLIRAEHKTYGTFFDYYIRPQEGEATGPLAKYLITRDEYLEAMKVFRDIGFRGITTYASRRDDLLWFLDRAKELGMKGDFVLIYPYAIKPEDIAKRGMSAFGWVIDEPAWYPQIPHAIKMYENMVRSGFTPTFTPNLPLGLIITDLLEKMVPIINTNGNAPYLTAATRRYKDAGRKVFWYEADGLGALSRPAERRALRGIYLWKEPVDGIFDWDDGSNRPNLSGHHMAGFAGTKLLPRLGLENIRQALTDLDYLNTLETLTKQSRNAKLRAESEQLMDWIRQRFDSDYNKVLPYIPDPQYLDDIRQTVADMIERIVKGK